MPGGGPGGTIPAVAVVVRDVGVVPGTGGNEGSGGVISAKAARLLATSILVSPPGVGRVASSWSESESESDEPESEYLRSRRGFSAALASAASADFPS